MQIITCVSTKEEPAPIVVDPKGNPITLRARVAYNMSGNIKTGYIDSLKKNRWRKSRPSTEGKFWWYLDFELLIENEETGKISKIKNPNSFVII